MDDAVADAIALDEDSRNELHGDGPRTEFAYRMAWVRTWLKNAGLLESVGRAVWSLTPDGRSRADYPVSSLVRFVQSANRRSAPSPQQAAGVEASTEPQEAESWREALLSVLIGLTADGFERLCQRILREAGFVKVEVT